MTVKIENKSLKEALEKGIGFLNERQLPSGEFPTMIWEKSKLETASYLKSVFIHSFILHSLKHVDKFAYVENISHQAINYLLAEKENIGLWRFYGRKSYIHFDLDTICCVLTSLKKWKVDLDYNIVASKLLEFRNSQGVFKTWIHNIDPPFVKKENNVDWVVNANVLYFYSLLGLSLPRLERYLIRVIETDVFKQRSPYYQSPLCFIYCLTRAYAEGNAIKLKPSIMKLKDYLQNIIRSSIRYNDPLHSALATVGLLNLNDNLTQSTHLIKYLLRIQHKDGGWSKGVFFNEGTKRENIEYGSEEFTTGIALEAISKYAERRRARNRVKYQVF